MTDRQVPGKTSFPGTVRNQLSAPGISRLSEKAEDNVLRAAVLYDGKTGGENAACTMSRMSQPLLLNFTAEAVDVSSDFRLASYDIVYPDKSIISSGNSAGIRDEIVSFAEKGGAVFLSNDFSDFFDKDFLGAESVEDIRIGAADLGYPAVCADLREIQDILRDYAALLPDFGDPKIGGRGIVPSTAVTLVKAGNASLYTVNEYGKGYVFLAGAMLPSANFIYSAELADAVCEKEMEQTAFSAMRLLESGFASFVSKRTAGFSLWRVFGCMGRPSMAWQYNIEKTQDITDGGALLFAETAKSYMQVPSYELSRNFSTEGAASETVSYYLGKSGGTAGFETDCYENPCYWGTHIVANNSWVSTGVRAGKDCEGDGGCRMYPYVGDLNRDGSMDLLAGSSDGFIYYYEGTGYSGVMQTVGGRALTGPDGEKLSVGKYSAPYVCDLDNDLIPDILCGAGDGCLYFFKGLGGMHFSVEGVLFDTGLDSQVLPELGDLNGDGYTDLVIGSDCGSLRLYFGNESGFLGAEPVDVPVFGVDGDWVAPRITDLNGDGIMDLAAGTGQGYIAKLLSDGKGSFSAAGFIEREEPDPGGENNIKAGACCCPFFADINGDSYADLICGGLESGDSYPADSVRFSYGTQLSVLVGEIKGNKWYIGGHFKSGAGCSDAAEAGELGHLLDVLDLYGVRAAGADLEWTGCREASRDLCRSCGSAARAGFLWLTGCKSPGSGEDRRPCADGVISLPFFLTEAGKNILLVQGSGTLNAGNERWNGIAARYGSPMLIRCGGYAGNSAGAKELFEAAENFRRTGNYGFVMENQLMYASAAAANLTADVSGGPGEDFAFTINPGEVLSGGDMYNWNYQKCSGARLSLGEALSDMNICTDANVCYENGSDLYISLDKPVRVHESEKEEDGPHIVCVNLPAAVSVSEDGASVRFFEAGMMQVSVEGKARTYSKGWLTSENDGVTVFTRYGSLNSSVNIIWEKTAGPAE